MIGVIQAKDYGANISKEMTELFVDAFYEYFRYFSKDKKILAVAFEHMLITERFYVGIIDGEIAGMAACTDGSHDQCIHLDKKILIKHLGIIKGIIAYMVFKKEFQRTSHELNDKTASIDFITVSSKHRRKGTATALINYICSLPQYRKLLIQDVADTNYGAIKAYEKAGFREYKRTAKKYAKTVGINAYISFEYSKE